jgi:hypothetical protein
MVADAGFMNGFDAWTDAFVDFVRAKGTVPPGLYRAFGYNPPSHRMAALKLKWRELRLSLGKPAAGSSPAAQQDQDLNRDATFRPGRGEGERLR